MSYRAVLLPIMACNAIIIVSMRPCGLLYVLPSVACVLSIPMCRLAFPSVCICLLRCLLSCSTMFYLFVLCVSQLSVFLVALVYSRLCSALLVYCLDLYGLVLSGLVSSCMFVWCWRRSLNLLLIFLILLYDIIINRCIYILKGIIIITIIILV